MPFKVEICFPLCYIRLWIWGRKGGAFSRYEKYGDISQMVHAFAKAELSAMEGMENLHGMAQQDNQG